MPKRVMVVAILVLIPAWAADGLPERVDSLLARWQDGDEAAKTGAVAETLALGEPAVRELYRRLAAVRDFGGHGHGLPSPASIPLLRSDRAITIETTVSRAKGVVWTIPDAGVHLIDDPAPYLDSETCEILTAPTLTAYEGQLANVTIARQQSYRRGKDAEGTVQLGVMIEMRAFVEAPGNRVTLDVRVVHSELAGEMGKVSTARGEVEIPQLITNETSFLVTLEEGKQSGIRLPPRGLQRSMAILLRAVPITLEEINLVEDGG